MGMTPTPLRNLSSCAVRSGFAAGCLGCIGTAHFMNGLLYRATLSSFRLKFDAKGFGFFDAAVQFFEQGRHLKWDIRSHRASARYWMAMFSRCSKQDVSFQHRFCRNKSYKSPSWRSMKFVGAGFASGEQQSRRVYSAAASGSRRKEITPTFNLRRGRMLDLSELVVAPPA